MKRARVASIALAALAISACSVDTEAGLAVSIDTAEVHAPAAGGMSASLMVSYRVGTYADGPRSFRPDAIQIYADGTLIAMFRPALPPTFMATLSPGQSAQATLAGTDATAVDPAQYCGRPVEVLVRWVGATPGSIGMVMSTTTVLCP